MSTSGQSYLRVVFEHVFGKLLPLSYFLTVLPLLKLGSHQLLFFTFLSFFNHALKFLGYWHLNWLLHFLNYRLDIFGTRHTLYQAGLLALDLLLGLR